jgi:hypothetical protein
LAEKVLGECDESRFEQRGTSRRRKSMSKKEFRKEQAAVLAAAQSALQAAVAVVQPEAPQGEQFKKDQVAAARAVQHEQNVATYTNWLRGHPEIFPCDANKKIFEYYMDFGEAELTPADFDFAYGNLASRLAIVAVCYTPEEIIAAENAHRRKLSLPELEELSQKENPRPQRDALPSEWRGSDISTAANLKKLALTNLSLFKALTERFGVDAVNERLGAVKNQPGNFGVKF